MYDAIFKIVIFGDPGCGKTTLTRRFMTNLFVSDARMTIGVDFETKILEVDGTLVKLMMWDFAGDERFRFMIPQYINGAMGGILMYDITNYASFAHISNWYSLIKETNNRFPIILLGGKLDLDDYREIDFQEGLQAARTMDLFDCIECSSKTGENIVESFTMLTRLMLDKMIFEKKIPQSIIT
ncbi:MAG: Rab family GTPase [Promethearchaeota archaeon]